MHGLGSYFVPSKLEGRGRLADQLYPGSVIATRKVKIILTFHISVKAGTTCFTYYFYSFFL